MKKVTKATIKKIIKDNGTVNFKMTPCKCHVDSMFTMDFKVNSLEELETTINHFEYYNCNYNELGKYPHFYI